MKNFNFAILLLCFQVAVFGQSIDLTYEASLQKPGYKLLFREEFTGNDLNHRVWDRSSTKKKDDQPCFFTSADWILKNVSVENGKCVIKNMLSTPENSECVGVNHNCFNHWTGEFKGGLSGEIKTFTVDETPDISDINYKELYQWLVPVGSYVETRLKTTDAKSCNVGSAFWLYGGNPEAEIDVFETTGGLDSDAFTSGYWSRRLVGNALYGLYENYVSEGFLGLYDIQHVPKVLHCGFHFTDKNEAEIQSSDVGAQEFFSYTINPSVYPDDHFLTYGVEFNKDYIRMYLNGTKYLDYNLSSFSGPGSLPKMTEKAIRLGTGQVSGGGGNGCAFLCPSQMEIDYVRVFYPQDKNAIYWTENSKFTSCPIPLANINNPTQQQQDARNMSMRAKYIPGVTYAWIPPAGFDFYSWAPDKPYGCSLVPRNNTPLGEYTISVLCTFPDGSQETLSHGIIYNTSQVSSPQDLEIACIGNKCTALFNYTEPEVCGCPENQTSFLYSVNGGETWYDFGERPFFSMNESASKVYCIKAVGCNGSSFEECDIIPHSGMPQLVQGNGNYSILVGSESNTIYPNPVSNSLYLIDDELLLGDEPVKIAIYDMLGKIRLEDVLSKKIEIDVQSLSNGMYYLYIEKSNQRGKIVKFIKEDAY